jgi:hypothetical protein
VTDQTPDDPGPTKATIGETRVVGVAIVGCGIAIVYFFWNYYISGIVPAPWLGYLGIALGLGCILFPRAFQERAGRFKR